MNLYTTNPITLRDMARKFEFYGDDNNAIKYSLKAIEYGNPLSCIDMCYQIDYKRIGYEYDELSSNALNASNYIIYIDKGIDMGSLDCMFFKARKQYQGDGYIKQDLSAALKAFKHLRECNYNPEILFNDGWTLDDYIRRITRIIAINKRKERF